MIIINQELLNNVFYSLSKNTTHELDYPGWFPNFRRQEEMAETLEIEAVGSVEHMPGPKKVNRMEVKIEIY